MSREWGQASVVSIPGSAQPEPAAAEVNPHLKDPSHLPSVPGGHRSPVDLPILKGAILGGRGDQPLKH